MDTRDWKPQAASKNLSFKWDYLGESLEANEILGVTLTLSVSNDAEGDFCCSVYIKGREINSNANNNSKGKGKTKQ